MNAEKSPWNAAESLWTINASGNATSNGRIACNQGAGASTLILEARDKAGNSLYKKVISAD